MAVKKSFSIAKVAKNAADNFVPPTRLASSEEVKTEVAREVATSVAEEVARIIKPTAEVATESSAKKRRVCIIPKEKGFPIFFEEKDKERLAQISFHNGLERQNVVRTAVHLFLEQYASERGLDEAGTRLVKDYEDTIYR